MALYPDSGVWVLGLKADLDGLLANLRVTRSKSPVFAVSDSFIHSA